MQSLHLEKKNLKKKIILLFANLLNNPHVYIYIYIYIYVHFSFGLKSLIAIETSNWDSLQRKNLT